PRRVFAAAGPGALHRADTGIAAAEAGAEEACAEEAGQARQEEAGAGEEEARQEEGGAEEGQKGREEGEEDREEEALTPAAQFGVQPGTAPRQVRLHGPCRDAEYFGGFLLGEAAEVPEFDDADLPRIDGAQAIERLADGQHLVVGRRLIVARDVGIDALGGPT